MQKLTKILESWPPAHHAYGISSYEISVEGLRDLVVLKDHSYIYHKSFDTFKIDDARSIKSLQAELTEKSSVFIIKFSVINKEAQNALLKVLEEPKDNTFFFLMFPDFKQLLPTLQSRIEIIHEGSKLGVQEQSQGPFTCQEFIDATLAERFELIKKYTDAKAGDEKMNKEQVRNLLNEIQEYFKEQENSKQRSEIITTLYNAQRYLSANGASLKMILDLVAVNLP